MNPFVRLSPAPDASPYLHRPLQRFLDVHAFAHDGLVQFALKRQQVHVGLRLRDQLTDLLGGETVPRSQIR